MTLTHTTSDGIVRGLGMIPAPPSGYFARWRPRKRLIPLDQYFEVNRREVFGPDWTDDQGQFGQCVGDSSATALRKAAWLSGEQWEMLSAMFLYAHINDGRDQGAMITDAYPVMEQVGIALKSEVPYKSEYIKKANIPASAFITAKRFTLQSAYEIATWSELCEAIMEDYIAVVPVMVGNTFENLDAEGISGIDGGYGNHAVCIDGLVKSAKYGWKADLHNSWGNTFGENGRCYVVEKHFKTTFSYGGGYVLKFAKHDPNYPDQPPAVK